MYSYSIIKQLQLMQKFFFKFATNFVRVLNKKVFYAKIKNTEDFLLCITEARKIMDKNINYQFKILYAFGIIFVVAGHCNGGGG